MTEPSEEKATLDQCARAPDPERQEKARAYARVRRRLLLVDLGLGGAYLLLWLLTGWSLDLREAISQWIQNPWGIVALYGIVFGLGYYLLGLPLAYYSGFILPHAYGQSNQTVGGWVTDQVKSLALAAVFGGFLLEMLYLGLRAAPETWWLWGAGFMLVFTVLLSNLAPVLLFPIFYKVKPLGEEHEELVNRLTALAAGAGTKIRGVYQFDMSRRTKSANAALTGLGSTRRIILGDTLLNEFTTEEIETVLAHELAHHVHRDIPLGIALSTVSTLVGFFLASLGLKWGINYFGFESVADVAALPLLGIVMGLFGLVTTPLENAYSRWRERMADRYALEATHNGPAFASAFTRLADQNLAEVNPEPWVEFLLYSHPALGKRIKMAEEFKTSTHT